MGCAAVVWAAPGAAVRSDVAQPTVVLDESFGCLEALGIWTVSRRYQQQWQAWWLGWKLWVKCHVVHDSHVRLLLLPLLLLHPDARWALALLF